MNSLYPENKWAKTNTSTEQLKHVAEEIGEVGLTLLNDEGQERTDEEMADLEHSIQTYWYCRAREGADVDEIRQKVIQKNYDRNHYPDLDWGLF